MTELCRLARKYRTDKTYYTPFYSLLLSSRRLSTLRVLEIGIGTPQAMKHVNNYEPGASLRMWEEYFPNAKIYGVDNDIVAIGHLLGPRISTIFCEQTKLDEGLFESLGPFDLIVDDGSHHVYDQFYTYDMLRHFLAPNGLYIIEDVNGSELSARLTCSHTDVFVKGDLIGHCVVLSA